MYAEVYEYLKLNNGCVAYSELVKWIKNWYQVDRVDAEYFLDKLLIDYDQVFEFIPMHNEGKIRLPRQVKIVEY